MSPTTRSRPPLGRCLLRLFTVQGSWNYERMQGVGMGVAEEPLLRDLRGANGGTTYHAALARGAHFFNAHPRSEEHTSELQSRLHLVCRLLLEKKKKKK